MKKPLFLKTSMVMVTFRVFTALSIITVLFIILHSNFLFFHFLAENFTVLTAFLIFAISWSGRDIIENKSIIILGIAYFFVAFLDSAHTITYSGMGVFNLNSADYPTQLWISARYIEAISILLASFGPKKIYPGLTFFVYLLLTFLIFFSIFKWHIFPSCYIDGTGLTNFKIISEYVIIGILLFSLIFYLRNLKLFPPQVYILYCNIYYNYHSLRVLFYPVYRRIRFCKRSGAYSKNGLILFYF